MIIISFNFNDLLIYFITHSFMMRKAMGYGV